MAGTPRSEAISTTLQQIADQAVEAPNMVFTTLAHHMTVPFLQEAFGRLKKSAASGIDDVTAREYAANLEENLQALYKRCRAGKYRATPVKRPATALSRSSGCSPSR